MKDLLKRRFVAVFALICALVLTLGANVFSQSTPAYADGEITQITLDATAPYTDTDTNTTPGLAAADGSAFTLTGKTWVLNAAGDPRPYSVYFSEGQTYYIKVTLTADVGSTFASSPNITVNGASGSVGQVLSNTGDTLVFTVGVVAQKRVTAPITAVSLTVVAPEAGTKAGDASYSSDGVVTIPTDGGYGWPQEVSNGAISWKTPTGGDMAATDTFQGGQTYTAFVRLRSTSPDKIFDNSNPPTVTVTGEGAAYVSQSIGTDQGWTTDSIEIAVTIGEAYTITTANAKATLDGVEVTQAAPGDTITLTAVEPTGYTNAESIELMDWIIDGTAKGSTATTQTLTISDHDVVAIARYKVTEDTSADASKAIVTTNLTVVDTAKGIGVYSGHPYEGEKTAADGVTQTTGGGDEPVKTMLADANQAIEDKIAEMTNGASYATEESSNNTSEKTIGPATTTTTYLDKDGNETSASGAYAVEYEKTEGDYGKETTYTITKKVSFEGTSVLGIGHNEGGKVALSTAKGGESREPSSDDASGDYNIVYGATATMTAVVEQGYSFVGWFKGVYGTPGSVDSYDPDTEYIVPDDPATLEWTVTDDSAIYARFEKKPTVTFIGSAIDSDELAEPYVIELEYGTSVSDLGRSIQDAITEHFTVDGYTPFEGYLYVMSKPLSELGNWGDIYNEDDVQYDREVTEDTTFYVAMVKIIDSVEASVDAPLCGVETTTPSQETSWGTMWFWQEQTNRPTYTAEGEGYAADYEDWGSFWDADETRNVPYIGTFVGDETYYAELWLTADFGYLFAVDDSGSADEYSGEAIIDGGTLVKTIYDMHSLGIVATVTADHDWDEGIVDPEPTCTEPGTKTCSCQAEGCEATKTEDVEALGHKMTKTDKVEPTCTEDGTEAYWTCSTCKKMFSDEEGKNEISNPITIEATDHDWGEWEVTKEATVDAEGEEMRVCKNDPAHTETRAIPKLDPIVYTNTAGDGNVWTKGSGVTSDFTFKRSTEDETTFSHFTKAQVDGKDLASADYTAESGSVVIKLNPSFLETLAVGEHTLTAFFDDGNSVDAEFFVVEGEGKTYKLTFNLDGGSWNGQTGPVVTPIPEGVTIVFTDDVPTKTGFNFAGWKDASGKVYKVGDTFEVTADATFTAVWEAAAKPKPKPATPATGDMVAFGSMAALAASGLVSLVAAKATRKED